MTHLIEYDYFTLIGILWVEYQVRKTNFMFLVLYLLLIENIIELFLLKNTFSNTGKKHIIHFMGLSVVFWYALYVPDRSFIISLWNLKLSNGLLLSSLSQNATENKGNEFYYIPFFAKYISFEKVFIFFTQFWIMGLKFNVECFHI